MKDEIPIVVVSGEEIQYYFTLYLYIVAGAGPIGGHLAPALPSSLRLAPLHLYLVPGQLRPPLPLVSIPKPLHPTSAL